MRLVLTGRNVDVTPALRQLVERRLARLERLLNDSALSAQVVLSREKYRHVSEVTIHARGDHMLHGVGNGPAWPASLRVAIDKITTQAQRLKGKWTARKRRAVPAKAIAALNRTGAAPEEPPAGALRIVRAARYPVKPMSVEDAALKVEADQEAFLVFRNAQTEAVNILYRRKDGHLGLIEP